MRAEQAALAELRAKLESEKKAAEQDRQRLAQAEFDALRATKQTLEERAQLEALLSADKEALKEQKAKLVEGQAALESERKSVREAEAAELRARAVRLIQESEAEAKWMEENASLEAAKAEMTTEQMSIEQERQRLQLSDTAARQAMKRNAADVVALGEQRLELEALKLKLASDELALEQERAAVKHAELEVLKRRARILEDETLSEALRNSEHAALEALKAKIAAENVVLGEERKRLAEVEVVLTMHEQVMVDADVATSSLRGADLKRPYNSATAGASTAITREQSSTPSKFNLRTLAPFDTSWPMSSPEAQRPSSATSPSQQMQMAPRAMPPDTLAQLQALLHKWHAAEVTASDLLRCGTRLCEATARMEQTLR
jgi:hypothetical protein